MSQILGLAIGLGVGALLGLLGLEVGFDAGQVIGSSASLEWTVGAACILGGIVGLMVAMKYSQGIGQDQPVLTRASVGGIGGALTGSIYGAILCALGGGILLTVLGMVLTEEQTDQFAGGIGGFVIGTISGGLTGALGGAVVGLAVGVIAGMFGEPPPPATKMRIVIQQEEEKELARTLVMRSKLSSVESGSSEALERKRSLSGVKKRQP